MFDQENHVGVDQTTTTSTTTATTTTTPISKQNNVSHSNMNNNIINSSSNPSLLEHDYCNPNKELLQPSRDLDTFNQDQRLIDSPHCKASSSTPPRSRDDGGASVIVFGQRGASPMLARMSKDCEDNDLSDSSLSLSSSDASSNKDLVIAHDSRAPAIKSLAPKDTPSVSRPKPGRRPMFKREMVPESNSEDQQKQSRIRRPRQNTSVTDKSQWITGEEQVDSALSEHLDTSGREKRKRKEVHDPEFSHFTSSEYSSSEAESENESDADSENDPDRPWCSCNQPHNGLFMINCDACEYWYHGHCVGVTDAMGKKYDAAKKDWFCPDCQHQILNGVDKTAIPRRLEKKEKKKTSGKSKSGRRTRGRPRKSEPTREVTTRMSTRNARKSTSAIETKLGTKKKMDARSESFEVFDDTERLKILIRERKKSFFYKRNLQMQQKQAKLQEMGLNRQPVTAPVLGTSLDSLATSTITPNMSNLPINIKSEHKERSKRNIVLQINTKKDISSDQDNQRLVTTIVKSKKRKHSEANDTVVNDLFTAEPLQVVKKSKARAGSSPVTTNSANQAGDSTPSSLSSSNGNRKSTSPSIKVERMDASPATPTSKRHRKDSESSSGNGSSTPVGSRQVAQKIKEHLLVRSKQLEDLNVGEENIEKIASDIENQLNECFKGGSPKYLNKYRSLLFNLSDKNQTLVKNVLNGEITPSRLVRMTPEDLATSDLAEWRERENKHSIELIKRDAQLASQQVIVKKTHKGEEVISAPAANEPDDPTADVKNQEPPTTPTKSTSKDVSKATKQSASLPSSSLEIDVKYGGALVMKISGATSQTTTTTTVSSDNNNKGSSNTISTSGSSLPFLDTTNDHKNHVYDMNCKICTKQVTETASVSKKDQSDKSGKTESSETTGSDQNQPKPNDVSQPKRLRVSIDTMMDPIHLSRLREPLIKPTDTPATTSGECSPSKMSPNADVDGDEREKKNEHDDNDDDDEELYDPEIVPSQNSKLNLNDSTSPPDPTFKSNPDEIFWSGLMNVPDVGKFSVSAKQVSGDARFMKDELGQNLVVCGRIAPDQVVSYIKKLKTTTKNQVILIQLHPLTDDDKTTFDASFDYLYSRNRCAVITTGASLHILKDFYIIPIHEKSHIPDVLKPIDGPGLNRKRNPNCLLGLLVKSKRPVSASSSVSSYTPTPINK